MERSIRIGKDFNVRWSINKVVDGERQPYELAGKELVLQYRTPYGLKEATEWKVVGNTIVWTFRGKEQKALGSYELVLTENGGKDGMVTVDTCRAFKLVAHSCEETEGSGSDIVIEDVVLESEVTFAALRGPQGERGPEGPQGPQGERGPQGEQGPAGPSYDDTEIKGKLTQLSEELASNGVLIEDLQNTKIDRENDDYYPKMAVGLADNLAGVDVVDSEINFRRSGGGAITDGVARIESIKGNSVVWNQLYNRTPFTSNGITTTIDGNTTIINGVTTASYFGIKAGVRVSANKMLMVVQCLANPDGLSFNVVDLNSAMAGIDVTASAPNGYAFYNGTYRANGNTLGIQRFGDVGTAFNNVKIVVSLYDLTKRFGAGNEPTTIEEFYQRAPMGVDLNAYNEGEVIHMDVQSIESVGVNQWDEEWEKGRLNTTDGTNQAQDGTLRIANKIAVLPNSTYYCKSPVETWALFYDKDGNVIEGYRTGLDQYQNACNLKNTSFVTPPNAAYLRAYFNQYLSTYSTYKNDICINLSNREINGKYFPYIKRVEDLSIIRKYFPQGMKSAGTAHDEIRYNKASGKWEYSKGRIKSVDLGGLSWNNAGNYFYSGSLSDMKANSTNVANATCSRYAVASWDHFALNYEGTKAPKISHYTSGAGFSRFNICDTQYTDAAALKASLQGVMAYYEAAEWEWVELDEADQYKDFDIQVWNGGTEKANAEGKSAPLAADITYGFNAIGKIKELESLVAALRAKVGI